MPERDVVLRCREGRACGESPRGPGGRCPPASCCSLSLMPRSGSSWSHTGVLAALQLRAAASQGSGNKRLFCALYKKKTNCGMVDAA